MVRILRFSDSPRPPWRQPIGIAGTLTIPLGIHRNKSELVATSAEGCVVPYERYSKALKEYCQVLGITTVNTHGLRHSTSELYMQHGATRDDLRQLFSHSDVRTTDRYVHARGSNLEKVSNVLRLFPVSNTKIEHVSEFEGVGRGK